MTDASATGRRNRGPSAAAGNRAALVEAARAAFAEQGYQVPLSAVARRAGVGQGSLYRHFPDRISLALAVFEENVAELEAVAEDPSSALDDLLDAITAQVLRSPAFIEMVHGVQDDPRLRELEQRMTRILQTELERDGGSSIAGWVQAEDVLMAVAMLGMAVGAHPVPDRAPVAERARRILRAALERRPSPPPVEGIER